MPSRATSTPCSHAPGRCGGGALGRGAIVVATESRVSKRSEEGGVSTDRLMAALPREMYVDQACWQGARDALLFSEWYCIGRLDDLGLAEASRVVTVDVAGESVLVTSDERRALHAAYTFSSH